MATLALNLRAPHRLLLDAGSEEAPPSGGQRSSSNEVNSDTTGLIILAALLCALYCALGFDIIFRFALRCYGRRLAFESADNAAARMAGRGLKKSRLRQIPVATYGSGVNIKSTDCAICLGEFADGEKVRVLPKCYHSFHVTCVDTWLLSHSSCPTCRQSLVELTDGGGLRQNGNLPGRQLEIVVADDDVG